MSQSINDFKDNAPILSEGNGRSFKREYGFLWKLEKASQGYNWASTANNVISNIKAVVNGITKNQSIASIIMDALASGEMEYAYSMFFLNLNIMADLVSRRAQSVRIPDDEIQVERYAVGNVEIPVASSKSMKDIQVTYVEDQFENVYHFHKIWQECLRPGSNMSFMDIPSFSIMGRYISTDDHLSESELEKLYEDPDNEIPIHQYSQTVYPLIFPVMISRGSGDATSKALSRVTVTYVRTPAITKTKSVTQIGYFDGKIKPTDILSTLLGKS